MKKKIIFTIAISLLACATYSQQKLCADSSVRIKFIFGTQGGILYNNPDTSGINLFTGGFTEGGNVGLALLKTTWGDSMIWAKKIYMPGSSVNSFDAPEGTIVCTGAWGPIASPELLISKLDTNGNIKWIKRFRYSPIHFKYNIGNRTTKNILIANDAIYFTALFNDYFGVVAKLDLDGNLKWSKYFSMNSTTSRLAIISPVYSNNILYILGASGFNSNSAGTLVLTRLDENNGNIVESFGYITSPDTLVKGVLPTEIKFNADNSISLTGLIAVQYPGYVGVSSIIFNTLLDANLDPIHNYYFINNIVLSNLDIYSDFNNQRQHAFLGENTSNRDKFFMTFGKDDFVMRTRKLSLPSTFGTFYQNSVNLDDKQNLHFIYHYTQGPQLVTEYARISNFAPSSTLTCFGKDTSILTQYPFTLIKSPFTWDNIINDVLTSNPVVFTEDTAIVTKELVCKIVSYCDSVHINGPATVCINQPVRYTVTKNAACLKSLQWNIDTAIATIVNTETDTAITLSFKQPFTGYIHAAVYNCVVNDSFFVTITAPQTLKLVNRDSLLCPGKTIILNAMPGFANYVWQDGSTGTFYTVTGPGFYKVTATNNCGLQTADSINITLSDTTLFVPTAQTICSYDTAYIPFPADITNITWQPTTNSLLSNNTLRLYPKQNTVYSIIAERIPNCPISKTIAVVVENCARIVFIPNSFTPNDDSRNDIFRVTSTEPLQFFRLSIYNRYGQKLFETNNPAEGWNGNFRNSKQSTGGYVYQCSYSFANGYQKTENGYFILIR